VLNRLRDIFHPFILWSYAYKLCISQNYVYIIVDTWFICGSHGIISYQVQNLSFNLQATKSEDCKLAEDSEFTDETDDVGLGVAQIVITAATPMEEIEHPFPGTEEADEPAKSTEISEADPELSSVASDPNESECKEEEETTVILDEKEGEETEEKSVIDELPADSAPFPISSSSGSEAESTASGPSNENSQSRGTVVEVTQEVADVMEEEEEEIAPGSKMLVGGRASIPDELQPDQLEKLQSLKESNA